MTLLGTIYMQIVDVLSINNPISIPLIYIIELEKKYTTETVFSVSFRDNYFKKSLKIPKG